MQKITKIQSKVAGSIYKNLFGDRRCRFNDLSKVKPEIRKEKVSSKIIQFYSSKDNIGNYLPVLGIQQMLAEKPDTWCIHDQKIDFDFINSSYKIIIIGGAGLLHECFEPFWKQLLLNSKLPMIVWGIGVCLPFSTGVRTDLPDSIMNAGVSREIITEVFKRCELVNVRDELTVNYYDMVNVSVSVCPTIVYLRKFKELISKSSNTILFSSHQELVANDEQVQISRIISHSTSSFKYTDNIQKSFVGIDDIISKFYCQSSIVVTTRLHGAIIAYGLGIPYIAIPRDQKLSEFHRMYSNGISIINLPYLETIFEERFRENISIGQIEIAPALTFGELARDCLLSYC